MQHSIRIQSYVDVITNSSTEVWQIASEESVRRIKEVINAILKVSGSEKTADDLFTFALRSDSVMIVPKNCEDAETFMQLNLINDLFDYDGEYNG
jgi:hypothetical protein